MEKKDTLQAKEERKEQRKRGLKNAKFRLFMLCMAVMSALSVNALAADETSAKTVSSILSENTSTIKTALSSVWELMTANPLMTLAICATVLSLGFRFFYKGMRAAHR